MEQTTIATERMPGLAVPAATPVLTAEGAYLTGDLMFGADRWRSGTVRHRWSPELLATSMLPTSVVATQQGRWLQALSFTAITSFLGEIVEIWVVPVGTRPTDLVGDFEDLVQPDRPAVPSPAYRALAAVAEVQAWLGIGRDDVAQLAGYSPRSIKNWREGMGPYPATVRRLFDIHALVGSLERRLGPDGTHVWLADAAASGRARRDLLGDEDGLRTLVSEAAPLLFEAPLTDARLLEFEQPEGPETPPLPDLFTGPVRRTRRRH